MIKSLSYKATVFVFCFISNGHSALVDITEFSCMDDYPIDVNSYTFSCDGGSCSFGDLAHFYGEFMYQNVTSETAYLSADITVAGLQDHLFTLQEINLCNNFTSDWGGTCPEDSGIYYVDIQFYMPSASNIDWLLTGFKAKSSVTLYSDEDGTDMIAECEATLVTKTQSTLMNGKMMMPTAAHFLMSMGGLIAIILISGCICRCRKTTEKDAITDPLIDADVEDDGRDKIEQLRSADDATVASDESSKNEEETEKKLDEDAGYNLMNDDKETTAPESETNEGAYKLMDESEKDSPKVADTQIV